ncbi:MAG: DUF4139 domain-containing protein [Shimia sp.]
MMPRLVLPSLLASALVCLAAFPAAARDVAVPAPLEAATLYPGQAELRQSFAVDLPEGRHVLHLPLVGDDPRIDLTGAVLLGQSRGGPTIDPRAALTARQAALLDAFEAAEAALAERQRAAAALADRIATLEAQVVFWQAVTPRVDALPTPDALTAAAEQVGAALPPLLVEIAALEARIEAAQPGIEDARDALFRAERTFDRSGAPDGETPFLSLDVAVPQAGRVAGRVETRVFGTGWEPAYTLRLDDAAGRLEIARSARIAQRTGRDWPAISVTLSTASPSGRSEAPPPPADIARYGAPPPSPFARTTSAPSIQAEAAPTIAPAPLPEAGYEGAAFVFAFDGPRSLTQGETVLPLGADETEPRLFTRAVPRRDATAFRMAEVTNDTGGPLLPGPARLFRDGAFVGETFLAGIPDGGTAEIGFGPVETLRLAYVVADRETGERGLVRRATTREEAATLRIENLGAEGARVEVLHALPVSEQEGLTVDIAARPAPDAIGVLDTRGLARWALDVAPGATAEIDLTLTLRWPEGEALSWRP